jgi:hypothetical protein
MAKAKAAVLKGKFPKTLPAGISVATINPKVYPTRGKDEDSKAYQARRKKEGKKTSVRVYHVDNAEGLKNVPGFISEAAGGDGEAGVQAGIAAWNDYLAGVSRLVTLDTAGESLSIVPPIAKVKTIDPFDVAASQVKVQYAARLAEGKPMTDAELTAAFKALL